MKRASMFKFLTTAGALAALTAPSLAQIEVIYSEINGHPTAQIPGALDAAGMPIAIQFKAIEDISFSPDGTRWVLRGRADADAAIDTFLLLGGGTSGGMLAQEAQPVLDGQPGEVYDFFDAVNGFNENNDFAFGARARNGNTTIKEKVTTYINGAPMIVATESSPITGAMDLPPNPSGDELLGNSLNSIHLLNDNSVGFVDLSTQNISSFRRPICIVHTAGVNNVFLQSGVTPIDFSIWDSFGSDNFRRTPDGMHYFAVGDDESATSSDGIMVYDGQVVVRENTVIAGTGITAVGLFAYDLLADGTWFARGDDPADNDWALRNGTLLAQTGDPIMNVRGVGGETWGNTFLAVTGNRNGDWVLSGNTNNADPALDSVIVLNGEQILVREGDPIDLDGNGMFDDDVFIGRGVNTNAAFSANDMVLTDDGVLYFIAPLRDSMGNDLGTFGAGGEAFLRLDLNPGNCGPCGDSNCDGIVSVSDIGFFVEAVTGGEAGWNAAFPGGEAPCDFLCANDINGDTFVTVGDIAGFVAAVTNGGCQ